MHAFQHLWKPLLRTVWDSGVLYRPPSHDDACMVITATVMFANVRVLICREHLNIVFIGHVDAGKSTTGGQILYLTVSVIHHLHHACRGLVLQHEQSQACMSGKMRRISCCSGIFEGCRAGRTWAVCCQQRQCVRQASWAAMQAGKPRACEQSAVHCCRAALMSVPSRSTRGETNPSSSRPCILEPRSLFASYPSFPR